MGDEAPLLRTASLTSGYITVALISMLWGTTGLFARWSETQPLTIMYYQAMITVLVLSPAYLLRRIHPFIPLRYIPLIFLSALFKSGATYLYFTAVQLTTLCYSLFAYYSGPVLIVFFASLLLHERTEKKTIISLIIAVGGVGLMAFSYSGYTTLTAGLQGILYALGGAVCFALTIVSIKSIRNVRGQDVLFYQMVFLLPLLRIFSGFPEKVEGQSAASILILALVHTCLAYAVYYEALSRVKAQHVGVLHYLDPVVASILGYLVFKEAISPGGFVGGALVVLAGLLVVGGHQ